MENVPAGGLCRRCNQFNSYLKITCDFCGGRLVWANAGAATYGEKCPNCQQFNLYLKTNCQSCESRLPWADCAAAHRAAKGNAQKEQKSLAATITISLILAFLVICFIFYGVLPTKQ